MTSQHKSTWKKETESQNTAEICVIHIAILSMDL